MSDISVSLMRALTQYYIQQSGRGSRGGIGPVYSVPPFIQRGHGIGAIFGSLWRTLRPWLWSGAKSVGKAAGRQALRTGGKILTEIADTPQGSASDIISKNLSEAGQDVMRKLRGGGRKRPATNSKRKSPKKRRATQKGKGAKGKTKARRVTKSGRVTKRKRKRPQPVTRDIFS